MSVNAEVGGHGNGTMMAMVKRVGLGGVMAGLVGGVVMIALMIVVMGSNGSGYASPLNLGIPGFAKTITPPSSQLPGMLSAMGVKLPPDAMAKFGPAIASGHVTPEMGQQLNAMLKSGGVPAAKIHNIDLLMSGKATNSTMADLLSGMNTTARNKVMSSFPVTTGNVGLGSATHLALSAILGFMFAMMIIGGGIQMMSMRVLKNPAGIVAATVMGAAIAYAVNRWLILPGIDPLMKLVPQTWFFIAHLLFGLVTGAGIAMIARREGLFDDHQARSSVGGLAHA